MISWKRLVAVTENAPEERYGHKSGTFRFPGEEDTEALFRHPQKEEYLELLRAKALLHDAPQALPAQLAEGFPAPGGLTWEEALALPWLEVPVPLLITEKEDRRGGLAHVLLALLPEGEKGNRISSGALSPDACKAMENALKLASEDTGRCFAAMPRHALQKFSGASLGLPLWLGARVLAGDDTMREGFSEVLATGALDEEGRLLPVDGVEEKADMAKKVCAARFLYPASSLDHVPPKGFPLHNVHDALFLLRGVEERFWRTVNSFRYDPDFFWYQLPAIRGWKKADLVHLALSFAEECGCLKAPPADGADMLGHLCDFIEDRELELGARRKSLLRLFSPEWAQKQERTVELFRLCQLHLTLVNRDGAEAEPWEALSEECRAAVQSSGRNVSSLFLSYYARRCESLHNQFFFTPGADMDAHIKEELARFEDCREHAVGEACGMLCQGAAFRKEHALALALADRSENNFGLDKKGRLHALRREADRAYIFWDHATCARHDKARRHARSRIKGTALSVARRALPEKAVHTLREALLHEKACRHALRYIKESADCKENEPFAEALKARMNAEARLRLGKTPGEAFVDEALRHLADDAGRTDFPHPWQLYFYNAGLSLLSPHGRKNAPEKDTAVLFLERSRELCRNSHGLTINIMALLPLSRLHALRPDDATILRDTEDILRSMKEAAMQNRLNGEHFAPLLKEAEHGAARALALLKKDPERFFPFNYR